MTIALAPLTDFFGVEITGVDLTHDLDAETFGAIRAALDTHGLLYFPDQPMDDDRQVAFSEMFGPLQTTVGTNPAAGTPFARQSNLDIRTGEKIPLDDPRMSYQKGNMLWHADSTFKRVPSLCSILTGRQVPPEGGATEFVSTACAYDALDAETQARIEDLVVIHDFIHSRRRTGFEISETDRDKYAPARHKLVRVNPVTGRKSLIIGAHARDIEGWPEEGGGGRCSTICWPAPPRAPPSTATPGAPAMPSSGTTAPCCTARRPSTPAVTSG